MTQRSYKDLQVWQKSIDFVEAVYRIAASFPRSEEYGLVSQLKRAAISIPSNIAEGSVKRSSLDFIRFINISRGSVAEIETQLIIAKRLEFIDHSKFELLTKDLEEISKMLFGLRTSLETRNPKLKTITNN